MKIAILGVGAMGSIYAGLLANKGHEVWAIDTWADHIDAIKEKGLRVEGASDDCTVRTINASTDFADAGACDLYIIATKASGVGSAAQAIAPMMDENSLVLTIQNGLGAGDRIAKFMPVENILLGVADGFGASMKGPGHAHHNAMNLIRLGEMAGGLTPRLEQVSSTWQEAGFNARAFADINQLIWEKYLCNVTFSAACTVFNCTVGELMNTPNHWKIALGAMQEAYIIGKAKNIAFSFDNPHTYVTEFGSKMPDARPSMLLDHIARRPSELSAINGQVPVMGQKMGIPTPYNEVLSTILSDREAGFAKAIK